MLFLDNQWFSLFSLTKQNKTKKIMIKLLFSLTREYRLSSFFLMVNILDNQVILQGDIASLSDAMAMGRESIVLWRHYINRSTKRHYKLAGTNVKIVSFMDDSLRYILQSLSKEFVTLSLNIQHYLLTLLCFLTPNEREKNGQNLYPCFLS